MIQRHSSIDICSRLIMLEELSRYQRYLIFNAMRVIRSLESIYGFDKHYVLLESRSYYSTGGKYVYFDDGPRVYDISSTGVVRGSSVHIIHHVIYYSNIELNDILFDISNGNRAYDNPIFKILSELNDDELRLYLRLNNIKRRK